MTKKHEVKEVGKDKSADGRASDEIQIRTNLVSVTKKRSITLPSGAV